MSTTEESAEESLRRIGKALAESCVVLCAEPCYEDKDLEDAAAALVVELKQQGFTLVPTKEYDELVVRGHS